MTLRQEAYSRIDRMTDDGIRVLIDIIDKRFKETEMNITISNSYTTMTKEEKKKRFLQSAGKINIDADAVNDLRERDMI